MIEALSLHFVEVSEKLSEMQEAKLSGKPAEAVQSNTNTNVSPHYKECKSKHGPTVYWYRDLREVPRGYTAFVAHEFFDALPIHKFQVNTNLSLLTAKPTNWHVRPVKTQISLGIRAQWVAKDPRFLHADSEDSDQTGRMPRLIWVFAGRTVILLVLSWGGSFLFFLLWGIKWALSRENLSSGFASS